MLAVHPWHARMMCMPTPLEMMGAPPLAQWGELGPPPGIRPPAKKLTWKSTLGRSKKAKEVDAKNSIDVSAYKMQLAIQQQQWQMQWQQARWGNLPPSAARQPMACAHEVESPQGDADSEAASGLLSLLG